MLNFEPSGALFEASLIMRDKETDSWWSIMQAKAIDGDMTGSPLNETTMGEKVQWGEWVKRHPDSQVLSVKGVTHETENVYQGYFDSEDTFRGVTPDDDRLPAKTPIFAFRMDGTAYVVTHAQAESGHQVRLDGSPPVRFFFWREANADLFAQTHAYRFHENIAKDAARGRELYDRVLGLVESGDDSVEAIAGMDTYWYNFIPQNEGALVLE